MMHTRRAPRRGFSLIELALSTSIMSILLLTLGSSVMLGSRAVPSGEEEIDDELALTRLATRLRLDLESATEITITHESQGQGTQATIQVLGIGIGLGNQGGGGGESNRSGFTLETVVADRTGDGQPETVLYAYDDDTPTITRTLIGREGDAYAWTAACDGMVLVGDEDDPDAIMLRLSLVGSDRTHEAWARLLNNPVVSIE